MLRLMLKQPFVPSVPKYGTPLTLIFLT